MIPDETNTDEYAQYVERVRAIQQSGARDIYEEAALRLAEKWLLHDEMVRARSRKGAIGMQQAAAFRRCQVLNIAKDLIAKRTRPYGSYRQISGDVARMLYGEISAETIRKILSEEKLLNPDG